MSAFTFLLKSTKNSSFGTAFCIKKDANGSYFITCSHVVEDCGVDTLELENYSVKVISMGSKTDIDLAVIYVEGLECEALKLSNELIEEGSTFIIDGFKSHKKVYKRERLNGSIKKISKIYSDNKSINTYELSIGNDDSIERGYSGSAIVSNGVVVAVATDRTNNGKQAYAVPIGYLGEIWEDMPDGVFVSYNIFKIERLSNMMVTVKKYIVKITFVCFLIYIISDSFSTRIGGQHSNINGAGNNVTQIQKNSASSQISDIHGSKNRIRQEINIDNNTEKLCAEGVLEYQKNITELNKELDRTTISKLKKIISQELIENQNKLKLFRQKCK